MIRSLLIMSLTLLSFSRFGWSQNEEKDLASYLQQLQLKLDHAAQRSNQPSSGASSVVGVRGTEQEPLSKQLYWKGKKSTVPVSTDEVKALRNAVEEARMGQRLEAVAAFRSFEQRYPNSALRRDADETLRRLGEAPSSPPKS